MTNSDSAHAPANAAASVPRPRAPVFGHAIPFRMPGFLKHDLGNTFAQAPAPVDCERWFEDFVDRAIAAIDRRFFPVCRMSDGEFGFLFGPRYRWPRPGQGVSAYVRNAAHYANELLALRRRGVRALTMKGVSSGAYSLSERTALRERAREGYALVARHGVVAIHLEFSDHPFNERYYRPLATWLRGLGTPLTLDNYAPFSFVYGLLRGPRRRELFAGRNVLAIHGATGDKRNAIIEALCREGAADVRWLPLSDARSFLDRLPTAELQRPNQVVLVGAGLGKPNIFAQLGPTNTLCIDAGYCFEVWADPRRQWYRAYLTPDDAFDWSKARFIDDQRRAAFGLPAGSTVTEED